MKNDHSGRVEYVFATDQQALDAMRTVSRMSAVVATLKASPVMTKWLW